MSSGAKPAPTIQEPPFTIPHHFSDIDVWKVPDRNFFLFIALSFLFGFFGTDHFYIRSFGTGMQKFVFNIFTLGFWYFWDIVQIVSDSKKVREEGLTSPFDWMRGIGRGVFIDPKSGSTGASKKDIVVYALMTLFGLFGMDKFYMGDMWQGFAKLFANFNLFFFFGWMWVIWDIVNVFFYPENILKNGIIVPPLFNMWFENKPVADLFIPQTGQVADNSFGVLGSFTAPPLPVLPTIPISAFKAGIIGAKILEPPELPELPEMPKLPEMPTETMKIGNKIVETPLTGATSKMTGGALKEDSLSLGPVIAGTLTAISLAGAVKLVFDLM